MSVVGYARVSTGHQVLEAERDALTGAGCERILSDQLSGVREDRPGLAELLVYVRPGDTVVVVALDRLGRSLSGVIRTAEVLTEAGVLLRSLREGIDYSTPTGRMLAGIFPALAGYERELMHERAGAARAAARARGRHTGRPPRLSPEQLRQVRTLRAGGESICGPGPQLRGVPGHGLSRAGRRPARRPARRRLAVTPPATGGTRSRLWRGEVPGQLCLLELLDELRRPDVARDLRDVDATRSHAWMGAGLGEWDREVLAFAVQHHLSGRYDQLVQQHQGCSATRYLQALAELLDRPDVLAAAPELIGPLRGLRDRRQRLRAAARGPQPSPAVPLDAPAPGPTSGRG